MSHTAVYKRVQFSSIRENQPRDRTRFDFLKKMNFKIRPFLTKRQFLVEKSIKNLENLILTTVFAQSYRGKLSTFQFYIVRDASDKQTCMSHTVPLDRNWSIDGLAFHQIRLKKFELGLIDLEFKLFPFFDIFEIPNASFVRFDNFIFWPFERAISN